MVRGKRGVTEPIATLIIMLVVLLVALLIYLFLTGRVMSLSDLIGGIIPWGG